MSRPELTVVTGAFGYTGKYMARCLQDEAVRVGTLTDYPDRLDTFGGRVQ